MKPVWNPPSLVMFTIYENPSDYPGKFVLRRWIVGAHGRTPDPDAIVVTSLDDARKHVPSWCINIGRMEGDDPVIREVWL